MSNCESLAERISFEAEGASLQDFAEVVSNGMGIRLTIEDPVPSVTIVGGVSDVPWDCVVRHVARQLGMEVRTVPGGIALVRLPPPKNGASEADQSASDG